MPWHLANFVFFKIKHCFLACIRFSPLHRGGYCEELAESSSQLDILLFLTVQLGANSLGLDFTCRRKSFVQSMFSGQYSGLYVFRTCRAHIKLGNRKLQCEYLHKVYSKIAHLWSILFGYIV